MKKPIIYLCILLILLTVSGLLAVFSATSGTGSYIRNQMIAYGIGYAVFIILASINPHTFRKASVWLYPLSVILLVAVIIIGTGYAETGSKSWIYIGGFSFQPSEFVKILFVISFSAHISNKIRTLNSPLTVLGLIADVGLLVVLICLQPDFGTAFVFIFTACVMLFVSGLKKRYFAGGIIAMCASAPILWVSLKEYQKNRLLVFLNPELDTMGAGFNVMQSKTALGSGGLFGQGYMNGMLTQSDMLPAKHTDFIFSVIGEEAGLIGCSIILVLLLMLILFCFNTALKAQNPFNRLLCAGIGAVLLCHTVINTGMCVGIFPVTGIPLPFISYGGTFVISNMASLGIVASIRSHLPIHCRKYKRGRRYKPYTG